ncbi:Uncharacterised protein [Serratia marcescens]|uniref:hypothetical protein n=1 Tax=Serratia marcescens TaxID=615 RepID=UPI000745666B|nr:hypothetical protein [Serratia marcescens]CVG60326.1 Uncharacterised protein [Serratia marcescens]
MSKLSELSNPKAFVVTGGKMYQDRAFTDKSTAERSKADRHDGAIVEPLYSQEYVSALLAERDAFEASALALRDEWRASKKSNAFLKEQLAQLANFNPDWDMLEACRESWREVAAALKEAEAKLEAKDDALRAIAFHVSAGGYNADSVDADVFKQKIIDGINGISDVLVKRIAELEAIRANASQVFKEIGTELSCNPDNESIMMAIDELKATQVTGPLALIIKRAEEMERILEGITPEMIAGGWTAKGISDYAKSLEAKLAAPEKCPCCNRRYTLESYAHGECAICGEAFDAAHALRSMGFKVEGDE